jgi:hypothetical protein
MTLQEKFEECLWAFDKSIIKNQSEKCDAIAEEFAIGFKLWSAKNIDLLLYVNSSNPIEIEKELLEIYKKEKRL